MTAFSNVGHVLTNTARNANQTTENYTCIAAPLNGPYLYKLDNSTGNKNIEYNVSSNTWNANPSTDGNHDPSNFLDAASNGSSIITPTNANNVLHIGYGTTNTVWMASFSVVYTSGPTVDSYNRATTTAVTKTFAKARIKYKFDDGVTVDDNTVTVTGGYNTFNVPSEIFCPRTRTTFTDYLLDLAKFNSVKLNTTRNGETYSTHFFGGTLPDVLDSTYQFVSLQAQAPFVSNNEWFINYKTYGFHIQNDSYDEIITGGSHNPAHSVLIRYNITTNTWVSNLGIVSFVNYPQFDYKILTVSCVSPSSTEQWLGFSNLSFTTTNLLKFVVENETNASSDSTPPQSEVEVAPTTTTSNGGGKRRRYPIISTNLFDRQKSIFSIGLTHKDETLF